LMARQKSPSSSAIEAKADGRGARVRAEAANSSCLAAPRAIEAQPRARRYISISFKKCPRGFIGLRDQSRRTGAWRQARCLMAGPRVSSAALARSKGRSELPDECHRHLHFFLRPVHSAGYPPDRAGHQLPACWRASVIARQPGGHPGHDQILRPE